MEKLVQYNVAIKDIKYNSSEEWSRIIERLSSVNLWPEGQEGLILALNLVGISTEDIENE